MNTSTWVNLKNYQLKILLYNMEPNEIDLLASPLLFETKEQLYSDLISKISIYLSHLFIRKSNFFTF
jgi:hypothetical protein